LESSFLASSLLWLTFLLEAAFLQATTTLGGTSQGSENPSALNGYGFPLC
jgi:hypothetical protein